MSNVGYTRESAKSRTNIDVVYCSKTVEIEIIKSAVTDHYTVQIVFSDYVEKTVPLKNKVYRDWTALENHLILEKMVFKIRDKLGRLMSHFFALDCDLAFEKFQEAIIEEVDNYIPLKKSKPSQQPNWIDNSIKNLAAKKQSLFQTFLRHKNNKNKEKFNKIRNKLRKKIKENKRINYQKMLHRNAQKNSSSFFNTMRTLSGNTRKEQEELLEKQVEGFNIYFTTIGKILSNKLIDPGKNGRQKRTLNSMFLTSANEAEISLVIKKLKNKYITDCDGLNNFILKKIEYAIVPTLTFLVNKCFEKGTFPKCLKKAVVIPIHKRGNAYEAQNYRPISLLPTVGKILEKLLCDRMTAFLEKYDLLNKNQFGFRQKRGTTDALVNSSRESEKTGKMDLKK